MCDLIQLVTSSVRCFKSREDEDAKRSFKTIRSLYTDSCFGDSDTGCYIYGSVLDLVTRRFDFSVCLLGSCFGDHRYRSLYLRWYAGFRDHATYPLAVLGVVYWIWDFQFRIFESLPDESIGNRRMDDFEDRDPLEDLDMLGHARIIEI